MFNWLFIHIQNKWRLEKETNTLDLELQAFKNHEVWLLEGPEDLLQECYVLLSSESTL